MTDTQLKIVNEAVEAVARHYGSKMISQGISPTPEAINVAVQANWDKVVREIATLSASAERLLVTA